MPEDTRRNFPTSGGVNNSLARPQRRVAAMNTMWDMEDTFEVHGESYTWLTLGGCQATRLDG